MKGNLDQAIRAVDRLGDIDELEALRPAGDIFQQEMSDRAPVGEGELAESMRAEENEPRPGMIQVGPDDTAAWRAHFPEFGTAFQAAQPWFRPAIDHGTGPAVEAARKNIVDQIRRSFRL